METTKTTTMMARPVLETERGWVRADDAAEQLGVHRATLWNWRKQGKIRFAKVGRTLFYDLQSLADQLDEFAKQNSTTTTTTTNEA